MHTPRVTHGAAACFDRLVECVMTAFLRRELTMSAPLRSCDVRSRADEQCRSGDQCTEANEQGRFGSFVTLRGQFYRPNLGRVSVLKEKDSA
jgi:hypothetical protein